jgi:hypothetical protein
MSLDCRRRSGTSGAADGTGIAVVGTAGDVCRLLLSRDKRRFRPDAERGEVGARRLASWSVILRLRLRDISLLVMFDNFSLNLASGRNFVTTTATSSLETVTKLCV